MPGHRFFANYNPHSKLIELAINPNLCQQIKVGPTLLLLCSREEIDLLSRESFRALYEADRAAGIRDPNAPTGGDREPDGD